jgi:predicted porin
MTTNRRVRLPRRVVVASILTAAICASPAHALWEAAEGEIFLQLDASVAADSNIQSSALELSDTIYTVTPGFSWERSRGRGSITLGAQCEIERASEYEAYDSENYSANFGLDMPLTPGQRLRGGISASYFDGSRVDPYQSTRISESSYDISVNGAYQVSNKINARAAASYGNTDPDLDLVPDYEDTSISIGAGYNFRPEVSFYVDARFTDSSSNGTETSGNAILVGLDGQITQKLSGHIGFGYDWSESEVGTVTYDYTGPTYDVALTWAPRERTTIALSASNGVQSTSGGGTDYTNFSLTLDQEIGLNMSGNAGITYRSSEFAGANRSDDVWEGTVGWTYAFTRQISMGLTYTYTNSESSSAFIDYTRSVWRLSGSARF